MESSSTSVSSGDNFTISVYVNPDVPVTGIEMDINFEPTFAEATLVDEGSFLQTSGSPTIFNSGDIDAELGTISNVFGVILGKSNTSSDGHFAHIEFAAGNSSGTYEFEAQNIVVSNEDGDSLPFVSQSVYVSLSSSGTSSSSSGGTGGGGGGSGSDGEPPSNVALKQISSNILVARNPASYAFDDPLNPIAYINFTPLTNAGQTKATVELLNDTSVFVDSPAGENVYANFNLWIGLAGYATPSNIEDAEIVFKVPMGWFEGNDISFSEIELRRYDEGSWSSLPTYFLFENEGNSYFRAQTPGFSPFAIVYAEKESKHNSDSSSDEILEDDTDGASISENNRDETIFPEVSQNGLFLLLIAFIMLMFYRR
ncbi:PGF-pre-PGF domain-containing protein [Methanohalophilus levihalophilus]|nr:PGF-pre-PGF domain-containing protein [Methanohalophilus levihalophilus]